MLRQIIATVLISIAGVVLWLALPSPEQFRGIVRNSNEPGVAPSRVDLHPFADAGIRHLHDHVADKMRSALGVAGIATWLVSSSPLVRAPLARFMAPRVRCAWRGLLCVFPLVRHARVIRSATQRCVPTCNSFSLLVENRRQNETKPKSHAATDGHGDVRLQFRSNKSVGLAATREASPEHDPRSQ